MKTLNIEHSRRALVATSKMDDRNVVYGENAVAVATGSFSEAEAASDGSLAVAWGLGGTAIAAKKGAIAISSDKACSDCKGVLGSWLVLASIATVYPDSRDDDYVIDGVVAVKVDGVHIMPNVYYRYHATQNIIEPVYEEARSKYPSIKISTKLTKL